MTSVLCALQRLPALYKALRGLRYALGRALPPVSHSGLAGRVHRNDMMMRSQTPASYRRVGGEAVALLERGLRVAGVDPEHVDSVLDYGCGYGRVTRVLAGRFGAARVSAFDVNDEGARFCAAEMGVRYVPFRGDWRGLSQGCYAAIWMGSVLTHLDARTTRETLDRVRSILAPGGVTVVTTQGEEALRRLCAGDYGTNFGKDADRVTESLTRDGFCFLPYPYAEGGSLGMTWMTPACLGRFVEEAGGLNLLASWLAAWDAHQDVHVLQASSTTVAPASLAEMTWE